MFEIHLATTTHAPPRSVTIQTPANNWLGIPGAYLDGSWVFELDEAQLWNKPTYFKFFLDDRFWMDDPYIRITPTAGGTYNFDESRVTFAMAAAAPTAPVPPVVPALPDAMALPVLPTAPVTEGAIINRVVVVATPLITVGAAWLAGVVARHVPGIKLDQTQIVSFMIAIVAVCLTVGWKWLQGWQQHELLVAQRLAAPIKPVLEIPTGKG